VGDLSDRTFRHVTGRVNHKSKGIEPMRPHLLRRKTLQALALAGCFILLAGPALADAHRISPTIAPIAAAVTESQADGSSLESAATRASDIGRTIAFSLIGLALAVAAVVLVFRRDFKEAVGVLAVGVVAVLLASPVGLTVLQDTVSALFGTS
jgi:hypothetical protein